MGVSVFTFVFLAVGGVLWFFWVMCFLWFFLSGLNSEDKIVRSGRRPDASTIGHVLNLLVVSTKFFTYLICFCILSGSYSCVCGANSNLIIEIVEYDNMWKKVVFTVLLAIFCYSVGILGFLHAFLLSFALLYYGCSFMLGSAIILRLLSGDVRKKFEHRQFVFHILVLGFLILFLMCRAVINKYYLPDAVSVLRVSVKVLFLFLTVFLCWSFLNNGWSKRNVVLLILFFVFISGGLLTVPFSSSDQPVESSSSLDALRTLGYVDWIPAKDNIDELSVTIHDPNLAGTGLNLYSVGHFNLGLLVDMDGKILHQWYLSRDSSVKESWPVIHLMQNGDVYSVCEDKRFSCFDWNSRLKWSCNIRAHHSFCFVENGDIYVLTREAAVINCSGWPVPMVNDFISVLSPEGQLRREIPITEVILNQIPLEEKTAIWRYMLSRGNLLGMLWKMVRGEEYFLPFPLFDVLHTNSIQVIDHDVDGLCGEGDILISFRELDMIAILNVEREEIVWQWGVGIVSSQHHATLLDNENILLFDNGTERGYSRVVELDPRTGEIVWSYTADPKAEFYSSARGSCQRLPNGNTLITDSGKGPIFEVTPSGKVVWKYYVPFVVEETKTRKALYRLMRISKPEEYPVVMSLLQGD